MWAMTDNQPQNQVERIREYMYMSIKREEPTTTAIAAGDYEKNLSECHI